MSKYKKTILIYSLIVVVILFVGGISYAYFSANLLGLESESTIVASSGEMTIAFEDNNPNIVASGISPDPSPFATKTFTLTGKNTTKKTMPYYLRLAIDENTFTDEALSFTIDYSSNSDKSYFSSDYAYWGDHETIRNFETSPVLGYGLFLNDDIVDTFVLKLFFLSTDKDQYKDMNKSFKAHIEIEPDQNSENISLAIKLLTKRGSMQGNGSLRRKNNGVIYQGENPDNYVEFNNELWRIVGMYYLNDHDMLKLIRKDSIGSYSWDSSSSSVNEGKGINEWSQSDLMKLLNPGYESESVGGSLYWNKSSGTCYSGSNNTTTSCDFRTSGLSNAAKSMISSADFRLYSPNDTTDNETLSFDMTPEETPADGIERSETWNGKVGLIYNDDYGRSVLSNDCSGELMGYTTTGGFYHNEVCHTKNWLYTGTNQWAINPFYTNNYSSVLIHELGYIKDEQDSNPNSVRPVVYLKPTIDIISGTGSITDPYIIEDLGGEAPDTSLQTPL